MEYKQALKSVVCDNWNLIHRESHCGNGLQLMWKGCRMIFQTACWYFVRLVLALTAPVSALLVMRLHAANEQHLESAMAESIRRKNG